jgi:hypothetical protein
MLDEPATASLVWTNPAAAEGQPTLVRLTPAALTLAVVPAADLDKVTAELAAGGDVPGQLIPISSLLGAAGDDDSAELTVNYRTGPSATASAEIAFADKEKREEFLVAVAGALGPAWERRQKSVSRWKAGAWLGIPTVLVALLVWLMYHEATLIDAGKPPLNWGKGRLRLPAAVAHWVERKAGPTGVLVGGGILVGGGVLLFLCVMASPPLRVVLEPAEQT